MATCQQTNEHDHPPNKVQVEEVKVRENIKGQAKQSHDKTGVVYTSSLVDAEDHSNPLRSGKGPSETSERNNSRKCLIIAETLS
ncbi:hypothetical protein DPMN_035463 [Dreissena polymorpha]|uniref:Uncharacterized protein n=1 Tax=Dreissena polymorpha TaxID=45954 RepID=A0A9D4RLY9_DREPO|nr:hypothetical protein DPMN_035463 [Dreissena polymorpha]